MAKGKQKDADAAYHRAEAQRALVLILDCAERTHEVGIAEAAATVRTHFLKVSEPAKGGAVTTLAGQLDIDGSVTGAPLDPSKYAIKGGDVPPRCPNCERDMLIAYGWSWTPMKSQVSLQCGNCGWVVPVSVEVYDRVRVHRAETVGAADLKPVKVDRGKKTRGAG